MSETTGLRATNIVAYRRYVLEQIISGLRQVFDNNYSKERQFKNLKISPEYPLLRVDYPAIVVSFEDRSIMNAGVGHTEWFNDDTNNLRQWMHRRFEGTLTISLFALSPLDRDLLCDAVVETLSFGQLDTHLNQFFVQVYGDPNAPVTLIFQQLMLNTDIIQGAGGNVSIAPWQPEDVLVYSRSYSIDLHGGIYNTVQPVDYQYVTAVQVKSYSEEDVVIDIPFPDSEFNNPKIISDWDTVVGSSQVSGTDSLN